MLRIRKEQYDILVQQAIHNFENRMYAHVTGVFPDECKALGEEGVRRLIKEGIERAARYGIEIEYDVARFVDLQYILAPDFDTNPEIPWAAAILKAPGLDATTRVDRLFDRTEAELKTLADQEGKGG
jgi:hypothetical protein